MPKVALIMGSDSDLPALQPAIALLRQFGVEIDAHVFSAHRTPDAAAQYARDAQANGVEVLIAAAGKAAHLPGVLAAYTTLPVIGIPIKASALEGMDALLSIVQMPAGVPVATVAINGAENAALLAVQMLALRYAHLSEAMANYKGDMAQKVMRADARVASEVNGI